MASSRGRILRCGGPWPGPGPDRGQASTGRSLARLVGGPPRRHDRAEKPEERQEYANDKYDPMALPERHNAKSDDEYEVEDSPTNGPYHFDEGYSGRPVEVQADDC